MISECVIGMNTGRMRTLLALMRLQSDLFAQICRFLGHTVAFLARCQQSLEAALVETFPLDISIDWTQRGGDLGRVRWWWGKKSRPIGVLAVYQAFSEVEVGTGERGKRLCRGRFFGGGGRDRDLGDLERETLHSDGRADGC